MHITSGGIYCHFSRVMVSVAVFTATTDLAIMVSSGGEREEPIAKLRVRGSLNRTDQSITSRLTTNLAVALITKLDSIGVNQTKSEIPIITSGHFARSYTIV